MTERAQPPEDEPTPAQSLVARSESIPLPPPRPTSLAALQELPRDPDPVDPGPRMVWSPGPAGIAVPGAAAGRPVETVMNDAAGPGPVAQETDDQGQDEDRIAGISPPLPPPRPGVPGESIGTLVSAFATADTAVDTADANGDALTRMGLRAPTAAQREEERIASLAAPRSVLRDAQPQTGRENGAQTVIDEPDATASTTRSIGASDRHAGNLLAAARDPAASYYTLFKSSVSETASPNGARARIAAVRTRPVENAEPARDAKARSLVTDRDIGLAGGFAITPGGPPPGALQRTRGGTAPAAPLTPDGSAVQKLAQLRPQGWTEFGIIETIGQVGQEESQFRAGIMGVALIGHGMEFLRGREPFHGIGQLDFVACTLFLIAQDLEDFRLQDVAPRDDQIGRRLPPWAASPPYR